MAFKPEKFTYQPLQEPMDFRLLELLPGERDETLKCSLTHSSLTSHPYYHALSYTWGTPGLFQEIELGGVAHSIQANLFDFLQQLRLTYAAVTLWVDALCIYSYRTAMKHLGNLGLAPQFSEGFDFAYLVGPIRTHELVWTPWSWFGILYN